MSEINTQDIKRIEDIAGLASLTKGAMERRIVGQKAIIEQLLIALFAGGHALFVGVPGLAKTLLIQTLAEALALDFNRVQFTPDLMPSDVTGIDVLEQDPDTGARSFRFVKGPVFTNLLLADEINRTPPKTQSALLQAMQEGMVTASGRTHRLTEPFHVFATQNPIEQEGTYPLPEAQLDRFMFMLEVRYPDLDEELEIVRSTTGQAKGPIQAVLNPDQVLLGQRLVREIPVPTNVASHAVKLVRATRPDTAHESLSGGVLGQIREYVAFGAGPRASQFLVLGAKARAALHGRPSAEIEDVRALAIPVLAHRVVTNFHAEAAGVSSAELVMRLLEAIRG